MDLTKRKRSLLSYLLGQLFEYDFMRDNLGYARAHRFDSYEDFIQIQTNLIQGFNEVSISTLEFIRDQFLPISEVLIDDDLEYIRPRGFYLTKEGKFVFIVDLQ